MFKKILIANRGEIACRVIKTAQKMGIKTVAVYSDADKQALHVQMADEAVHIGNSAASESYLIADKIIAACKQTGAEAVHPGYGFLSENAGFCDRLTKEGIVFIGPGVKAIEAMGDKITSKKLAAEAGVSTVPGYMGLIKDAEDAVKIANEVGYPVMIKASAGGGGKGMRVAWNDAEAREGFDRSKSEAASSFGDDRIFIEKFVTDPRHIEIQILADSHGNCIYLGERECSIQRRNQKVIEEAPSPFLDQATRVAMGEQSVALAKAVDYASVGTVEFIVDGDRNFYFLEMNTRLQVEHPVTELVTGLDLVEQMLRVAAGEKLTIKQAEVQMNGWAMESRLYAEDPYRNFLPSIGRLTRYRPPTEGETKTGAIVRNDTGVYEGGEISMFYDPMIAKLCTWGKTRADSVEAMSVALDTFEVEGVGHNLPFLSAVMTHERFLDGRLTTGFIAEEFPDGFSGAALDDNTLSQLAAAAAAAAYRVDIRHAHGETVPHEKSIPHERVVVMGETHWHFDVTEREDAFALYHHGGQSRVDLNWEPGDTIAEVLVDGAPMTLKINRVTSGFRLRYRGADIIMKIVTPRVAKLMEMMPEKLPPDTSKLLLCPMPGLVVSLHAKPGDSVEEGQTLAIVEAMKMENVLRAIKSGVVKSVPVNEGESLAVDAVIMEFEA